MQLKQYQPYPFPREQPWQKVPEARWLEARKRYFLAVLEATNPKSKCQQGHAPSGGSRGEAVPCLSLGFSAAPNIPWLGDVQGLPHLHISSCVSASVFSSYKNVSQIRAQQNPAWFYLHLILSAKTLFPNKVTVPGCRVKTSTSLSGCRLSTRNSASPHPAPPSSSRR